MAGIIRVFSLTVALFTLFCSPGYSQSYFWQQTNGPFGGTVNSLVSKSNGDIFAGTESGGVFRSSDNSDTWSAVNNGLTGSVTALAINGRHFCLELQWCL